MIYPEDTSGLRVSVLASGSTGNATYIESDTTKILLDCGLTGKKMHELFEQIHRDPKDLDAILVTHEHSDHIKGVGVLSRRHELDIYANEKTWGAMNDKIGKISLEHQHHFQCGQLKTIGDIDILSFGVSHDAADPQFYAFQKDDKRFVVLTDTGYVSDQMRYELKNADAYLIESNHDLEMLRMGPYPWYLKQRILSDKGHLSNEDSSLAIAEMIGDHTKRIYLGHLSQKNNMKEIARGTVEDILLHKDTGVNDKFFVYDTDPEESQPLFKL